MTEKVQPGQAWHPPSAADQNAWSETADDFMRRRRLGKVHPKSRLRTQTDIIKVKNTSGGDRRKGEVLGVFDKLVNLDDEHIWLDGDAPASDQGGFGILKRPTPSGKIDELQVSGAVIAFVEILDVDHGRAIVVDGDHVLQSAGSGPVQILWAPTGLTGEQECVVLLGGGSTACHEVRFQVVSADPSTRTALGEILSRPPDCALGDIPEATLGGTVIEICDPMGCFFNEPNEELTGRQGWARYMMPVSENICQPDPNYLVPQWEVFSLCCAVPDCDA